MNTRIEGRLKRLEQRQRGRNRLASALAGLDIPDECATADEWEHETTTRHATAVSAVPTEGETSL